MSDWRVRRHYGFGAARVSLSPVPHFVGQRSLSMGGALRDAGADFYLTVAPPLVLAVFVLAALFVTTSRDKGYTDLEVVMIQREAPVVEQAPEPEPLPIEEPPPPRKMAEKKPEPPPPKKEVVKPEPPPPPPVQRVAKVKPPPRPAPKPVVKPKPVVRPQIDAVALAKAPEPPSPPPVRRGNRVREIVRPKMELAPVADAPDLPRVAEPERPRRFAAVRAEAPSRRPRADLGPPIAARPPSAPAPEAPAARTHRPAPVPGESRSRVNVSFAAAAPPPPPAALAAPEPAPRRGQPVPSDRRRSPPPPAIAPALSAVAPAARAALPEPPARSFERSHTDRATGGRSREDRSGNGGLSAVPLASLAACVSEAEEDALKRRLVAAVTTQRECVNRAGTYRFVETKNLNAFLMTIERAPGRPVADRCVELRHALDCVER